MPRVIVDNETIEVPPIAPGSTILNNPAVQQKAQGNRTVFLVDPDQTMEIVDPNKEYRLRDGTQIDSTAPSVSGAA